MAETGIGEFLGSPWGLISTQMQNEAEMALWPGRLHRGRCTLTTLFAVLDVFLPMEDEDGLAIPANGFASHLAHTWVSVKLFHVQFRLPFSKPSFLVTFPTHYAPKGVPCY